MVFDLIRLAASQVGMWESIVESTWATRNAREFYTQALACGLLRENMRVMTDNHRAGLSWVTRCMEFDPSVGDVLLPVWDNEVSSLMPDDGPQDHCLEDDTCSPWGRGNDDGAAAPRDGDDRLDSRGVTRLGRETDAMGMEGVCEREKEQGSVSSGCVVGRTGGCEGLFEAEGSLSLGGYG